MYYKRVLLRTGMPLFPAWPKCKTPELMKVFRVLLEKNGKKYTNYDQNNKSEQKVISNFYLVNSIY